MGGGGSRTTGAVMMEEQILAAVAFTLARASNPLSHGISDLTAIAAHTPGE
jgi:hypothetical protein